eukprot:COSAG01_NODE_41637_length_449_cov_0.511429_1_plen_53_part_00
MAGRRYRPLKAALPLRCKGGGKKRMNSPVAAPVQTGSAAAMEEDGVEALYPA